MTFRYKETEDCVRDFCMITPTLIWPYPHFYQWRITWHVKIDSIPLFRIANEFIQRKSSRMHILGSIHGIIHNVCQESSEGRALAPLSSTPFVIYLALLSGFSGKQQEESIKSQKIWYLLTYPTAKQFLHKTFFRDIFFKVSNKQNTKPKKAIVQQTRIAINVTIYTKVHTIVQIYYLL